jgi:acyl carrier protein phosphodiesterase
MLDSTKKIISDIKDIKIQGATNIVLESTIAIESELKRFKGRNIDIYFDNLLLELWKTRPTEPALKTFLTHFKLKFNKFLEEMIIKSDLITFVIEYRENLKDAVDKIADDLRIH